MDLGMQEILLILFVALLVYGGNLPTVARSLGRVVGEVKRGFTESAAQVTAPLDEMNDALRETDRASDDKDEDASPRRVLRIQAPVELATEDVSEGTPRDGSS